MAQGSTKTAIVTGAASGIGLATAKSLQASGYRVFGTSRKAAADTGGGIRMLVCDVTDEASVADMVEAVFGETGRVDLLVNNAGFGISGPAEETSVAQAQAMFDVNLFGVIRTTQARILTWGITARATAPAATRAAVSRAEERPPPR